MDWKYISLILLVIAFILLVVVIRMRMQGKSDETSTLVLGISSVFIIVAAGIGVKIRNDNGMKTSDYIQLAVVVFTVVGVLMAFSQGAALDLKVVIMMAAVLSSAQLNDF